MKQCVDLAQGLIAKGGQTHLIGIGGIGMAGVAYLLKQRGFTVSGCDLQGNRQTAWLQKNGIEVVTGHNAEHITSTVDWLIRSTAVPDSHPEVRQAIARGIPVSRRGEVLPALMRDRYLIAVSGTHGKTTTTALIAQVLGCGYCVGGEIAGFPGVAKDGKIMVVEADESDGTVAGYSPDLAVITNIEYDHMEHHASEAAFIGCFEKLIQNTKERLFYCGGDPIAKQICSLQQAVDCEPYFLPSEQITLPLRGRHNQWNASAVLKVCRKWLPDAEIRKRLANVQPVGRRFETVFDQNGIRIISDYAHHPTEIAALIQTAQELNPKRLLGIFQPHRYTRTLALGADFPPAFAGLDRLWLTPVYAASESPLAGGTSRDLFERFPAGHAEYAASLDAAWDAALSELQPDDLLLIIGAGDIEKLADRARQSNLRMTDH